MSDISVVSIQCTHERGFFFFLSYFVTISRKVSPEGRPEKEYDIVRTLQGHAADTQHYAADPRRRRYWFQNDHARVGRARAETLSSHTRLSQSRTLVATIILYYYTPPKRLYINNNNWLPSAFLRTIQIYNKYIYIIFFNKNPVKWHVPISHEQCTYLYLL